MLDDPLLGRRLERYIEERWSFLEAGGLAGYPTAEAGPFLEREFRRLYGQARDFLRSRTGGIPAAIKDLGDRGLALGSTAASHALLPLLAGPGGRRAQVRLALRNHRNLFDRAPDFFWLPECAYAPGLEEALLEEGLNWALCAESSLSQALPPAEPGRLRALGSNPSFRLLGRDESAARWVWDRTSGYPSDPAYREYHRDLGYDREPKDLQIFAGSGPLPRSLGFKGHRVTGRSSPLGEKQAYEPAAASRRAREHAREFIAACAQRLAGEPGRILAAAFDAELFGHWWYEGPVFLDELLSLRDSPGLRLLDPRDLASRPSSGPPLQAAPGSWGREGDFSTWLNEETGEDWARLRRTERRLAALALEQAGAKGALELALNCALRALLLAQASDWTFMISQGPFRAFGRERLREALDLADRIMDQASTGKAQPAQVRVWAQALPLFLEADFRDILPRPSEY